MFPIPLLTNGTPVKFKKMTPAAAARSAEEGTPEKNNN
jgi:hypothetical protein